MIRNDNALSVLNRLFDEVYVLTLPHATARQDAMKAALEGLNYRFYFGVNKQNLDDDVVHDNAVYDDRAHRTMKRTSRSMTKGEIACALSHRNIWQDALDNGHQRVLVLEDDALPVLDAIRDIEQELTELPDDWDVMLLGYYGEKTTGLFDRLQIAWYHLCHHLHIANWHHVDKKLINMLLPRSYSASFNYFHKAMGTHAYALNAHACRRYIDFQTPVKLQADRIFQYYFNERDLNVFMPKRKYFTLSELSKESFIQNDRKD